jgi:hypothetical protein
VKQNIELNSHKNGNRIPIIMKSAHVLFPCCAAVMIEVATPAQAAMESFTQNYGSSASPLVISDAAVTPYTDFPETLSLPQFNPSQGTLTEIILTLSSTDIIGSEVYNYSSSTQSYTGAQALNLSAIVAGPYGLQTSETLSTPGFSGTVGPSSFAHAGSVTGVAADSTVSVPTCSFSQFTGSGLVALNLLAAIPVGAYSGSGQATFFGGYADSFGALEVQYVYTAVPEPGTLWAGLAAVGFGLFRLTRSGRFCSRP